jgi:hypothetical protein
MGNISIAIKDELHAAGVEAVAAMGGYQDTIPDPAHVPTEEAPTAPMIPNPQTKENFWKQQVKAWNRNQVIEYANRQALANVTVVEDN